MPDIFGRSGITCFMDNIDREKIDDVAFAFDNQILLPADASIRSRFIAQNISFRQRAS
jgi:hypothetical protein